MDCHIRTNRTVWKGPVSGEHTRTSISNITPDDLRELLGRLQSLCVLRLEKLVSSKLRFKEQHPRSLLDGWLGHFLFSLHAFVRLHLTRLSAIRTQRHVLADVWKCAREHLRHTRSDEEVFESGGVDQMKIKSLAQGDSQWVWLNTGSLGVFLLLMPDNNPLFSLQVIFV